MQQADRHRFDSVVPGRLKFLLDILKLWRRQHVAIGVDSLICLDDPFEQWLGLADHQIKEPRTVLVADQWHIGKSLGGDQCRSGAFASQQGVGSPRGAEPHRDFGNRCIEPQREHMAYGQDRSFFWRNQFVAGPGTD